MPGTLGRSPGAPSLVRLGIGDVVRVTVITHGVSISLRLLILADVLGVTSHSC